MTCTVTPLAEAYEYISPFRGDRAVVYTKGRRELNFIDPHGRRILPEWYPFKRYFPAGPPYMGVDYSEGLVALPGEDGKCGYLDTDGHEALPFIYEKARHFIDGLACVMLNGKYGLIDKSGAFVIPPVYDMLGYGGWGVQFREGKLFAVRDKKGGFIDRTGETVIPFDLDPPTLRAADPIYFPEFGDGLAPVSRGGRGIFMDAAGREVLPIPAGCTGTYGFMDGLTFINYQGDGNSTYCRIMRRDGSWLLGEEYAVVGLYRCGRIQLERDGKRLFCDRNGDIVIDGDYSAAFDFDADRAWVKKDGKWGSIDTDGNVVVPFSEDYTVCSSDDNGNACITVGHRYGVMDRDGRIVIPSEYDASLYAYSGKIVTKKDGQWVILHVGEEEEKNE